jgi:Uma2 family endonuclease
MSTAVSLSEYLNTRYRPDCDHLDGQVVERNVAEWDHSRLRGLLGAYLCNREKQWGIYVVLGQRMKVTAGRFRVSDITVIAGDPPVGPIITSPPFLSVEILSPSDRLAEMQDRIDDYLSFGVRYVWVINPQTRHAYIHTAAGIQDVRDGVLTTENPDIRVVLSELE